MLNQDGLAVNRMTVLVQFACKKRNMIMPRYILACDYCHKHVCDKFLKLTITQYTITRRGESFVYMLQGMPRTTIMPLAAKRDNTETEIEKLVSRIESLEGRLKSFWNY